ncbi:MAG: exopolyphosphatase, partial [Candidatus Adiutrix sp.]|nr:exopolyphosphatase [Candidatus Adiutrix sp.]
LTAAGVLTGLGHDASEALIFDIGGRSTEFVTVSGGGIRRSLSLSLGVVGLTEEYLSAPARPGQLEAVAGAARAALAGAGFGDVPEGAALVGTAGTVTTIAALLLKLEEYDPVRVNNARLARSAVAALLAELAPLNEAERVTGYGLHPRRADALPAGLALVLEIMDHFRRPDLVVSDNGLLEGIWLRAAAPTV